VAVVFADQAVETVQGAHVATSAVSRLSSPQ
jgi:hypothetical protein